MEKVSLRDKAKKSSLNSRACKTCKFKYTCVLGHHLYPYKVIEIFATERGYVYNICKTNGTNLANSGYKGPDGTGAWNTYEQAKEAGLQDALKLILMYNDVIK